LNFGDRLGLGPGGEAADMGRIGSATSQERGIILEGGGLGKLIRRILHCRFHRLLDIGHQDAPTRNCLAWRGTMATLGHMQAGLQAIFG
jgi:hypothetical protein